MTAKKTSLGLIIATLVVLLGLSSSAHAQINSASPSSSPSYTTTGTTNTSASVNSTSNTGSTNGTTDTSGSMNGTTNTTNDGSTVGLPNTGVAGNFAVTVSSILASLMVLAGGAFYFTRRAIS